MLCDILVISAIWMGAAVIYSYFGGSYRLSTYAQLWPFLFVFVLCNDLIRLYHGHLLYPGTALPLVEEIRRLFLSVTITHLLLSAYLIFTRKNTDYSRVVLMSSWIVSVIAMAPCRQIARLLMKKLGIGQIPVLIAGAGPTGRQLAEDLEKDAHFGLKVEGFFDDRPDAQAPVEARLLGNLDTAVAEGKSRGINTLVCCLPLPAVQRHLKEFMRGFQHLSIVLDNYHQEFPVSWAYPIDFGGLAGVELRNQLLQPGPRIVKALLEALCTLLAATILLPLFVLLALLVKLSSPGPVIYRAQRLGQHGKTIHVWKFRTMYRDADEVLKKLLDTQPKLAEQWQARFKLENDPRVTPLGRFLRRTSLDELPQFINVLRGEMALVGPRPIVESEKVYYGDKYSTLARVKPGITGLWQVSGRNRVGYERRVFLDMYYVANWSIWLDYMICLKTLREIVACRGQ
jgi:Undecaprenyl-phosphate galactose phosphotransferase WbaP